MEKILFAKILNKYEQLGSGLFYTTTLSGLPWYILKPGWNLSLHSIKISKYRKWGSFTQPRKIIDLNFK